jgi:beta-lactamase regulating signal transducer with metallopeptidase domain
MILEVLAFSADHVITVVWLKATMLLSLLMLAQVALRRWSAGSRAAVWTVGVSALVVLPAGHYFAPQAGPLLLDFPVFLYQNTPGALTGIVDPAAAVTPITWPAHQSLALWIAGIWLAGTVSLLARLAWQTRRLAQIANAAQPAPGLSGDGVAVGFSSDVDAPLTFGWRRPRILLPMDAHQWTPDVTSAVLAHELAHVQRRDYLALILTEIAKALYWINPLAWRFAARVRAELECACDDAVLRAGIAPVEYVRHLVGMATRPRRLPEHAMLPMARRSLFPARVRAILDQNVDRRGASARDVIVVGIISLLLVSSLAGAAVWACPATAAAMAAASAADGR